MPYARGQGHMYDSVCVHTVREERNVLRVVLMLGYMIHMCMYPTHQYSCAHTEKINHPLHKCMSLTFHSSPKKLTLTSADILLS